MRLRLSFPPVQFKGDVELSVVAFDGQGLLQSLSTGVVVPEAAVEADAALRAAVEEVMVGGRRTGEAGEEEPEAVTEMRRRLESQQQKLGTTPEGTMAWEKVGGSVGDGRGSVTRSVAY